MGEEHGVQKKHKVYQSTHSTRNNLQLAGEEVKVGVGGALGGKVVCSVSILSLGTKHPLCGRETIDSNWAASMNLARANSNLGSKAEPETISEAGGRVVEHTGAVDL